MIYKAWLLVCNDLMAIVMNVMQCTGWLEYCIMVSLVSDFKL